MSSEVETVDADADVSRWSDDDHYQLYHEALQWIRCNLNEVEGMCLKSENMSI